MSCGKGCGACAPLRVKLGWRLGMAGVSLIELLISMAISSVAISASIHMFSAVGLRFTAQHSTMATNQDLRLGLDVLCSEIRLAGSGLLGGDAPFLKAKSDEVEFFAGLSGESTTLTQMADIARQELSVEEGAGWPKGKQVLVCTAARCLWNQLAADGRKHTLSLATPLGEPAPIRSAVFLLNRVRYYVKRQDDGVLRVMRDVDGGSSTLLGDVRRFELQYLDRNGAVATEVGEVVRVRITIQAGRQGSTLLRDVAIRM